MNIDFISYLYSRKINGSLISHQEQNNEIRKWCTENSVQFPLANTEFNTEGSWFVLRSILQESTNETYILFFSTAIIKVMNSEISKELDSCEENKVKFIFCKENVSFSLKELKERISEHSTNELDFFKEHHTSTVRNYFDRMNNEKPEIMKISKNFSYDYWDGDRTFGYGGYKYDGRWERTARKIIDHYCLDNSSKVLDLGCGKGYLLYELKVILPGLTVVGLDISKYAIENSKIEVREFLSVYDIKNKLNFKNNFFDLTLSLMTLHNLELPELEFSLSEISRVSTHSYITVESYRSERELTNLQCWALTCEMFLSPRSWEYLFSKVGYTGDYEFLYFE